MILVVAHPYPLYNYRNLVVSHVYSHYIPAYDPVMAFSTQGQQALHTSGPPVGILLPST